jgi:putative ABC transport system permease protein
MLSNLKHAFRTLARQPGFTLVVVLTLALGIGATVAIFSVVNAVLLRDLPYPHAGRLVALRTVTPDGAPTGFVAPRDMPRIYDNTNTLDGAAICFYTEGKIVGGDGTAHNMGRYGVTDQFFKVFDLPMTLGRGFNKGEPPVSVVISYSTWRDIFGSDPKILGKVIQVENGSRPVVGVAPEGFDFPGHAGYWTLMQLGPGYANLRGYQGYLRLKPGIRPERVEAELASLSRDLGPDATTHRPVTFVVQPLLNYVVGDLKPTVLLLFSATAILLLIACINVANLLLSRGAARTREIALRQALGAGRVRILGHLLTESFLLSAAGGALGLALAAGGIRILLRIAPADIPRLNTVPIDGTVLLFALTGVLVTSLLIGFAPAWRLSRSDLRTLVNDGGRGASAGAHHHRTFGTLVVAEIGLAVLLVIGSGLLIRSYYNLITTDPGFRSERTLSVFINVPFDAIAVYTPGPPDAKGRPQFTASYAPIADYFRELESRIAALSGVEAVSATSSVPLNSQQWDGRAAFTILGQPAPDASVAQSQAVLRSVSPNFFSAFGVRLLSGRSLQPSDRRGAPGVAVINETFARRYFPGENPVGHTLNFPMNMWKSTDVGFQYGERVVDQTEIVGVVSDVKYITLAEPPEPAIYFSNEQFTLRRNNIVVRTAAANPAALIPAIRHEIDAVHKSVPAEFSMYNQIFSASLARQRLGMSLLAIFGIVALALAAVGIYGLMSYSVAQRASEIAVRAALGASAGQVLSLILRRGAQLALSGIAIGVIAAVVLRRVAASQLYEISALDPAVFVLVPLTLLAVAMLASCVPARRAAKIDPAVTLRQD